MRCLNDEAQKVERLSAKRREEIRNTKDSTDIRGNVYYVAAGGNDDNDGRTPGSAWATPARVSAAELKAGDGVLFRRGDVFRGCIKTKAGVTYGAFGEGEKPRLYGWDRDLADPALWDLADAAHHIWKMKDKILDPGTLVFDEGEAHSRKLIPSYINGRFVCREDESQPFVMGDEMSRDLDIFWHFDSILTQVPSKGCDFPVPEMGENSYGDLYVRCDGGNPGSVFASIEALTRRPMFIVGCNDNVHIDNLCIKYVGLHGVQAGRYVKGLHVTNCEFGWIGGTIQHYFGTDPNYPQGGRGTVTRFGNAVEVYGGCEDYLVSNCYIYEVYDAGITHQITTNGETYTMEHIRYENNLIENCVYAIEYFLDMNMGDTRSCMRDVLMKGNILRLSGYGWGQQRHNVDTPALIKGWSYVNRASDYRIEDNIFDRCAYRMLHLVALEGKSCPRMSGNTYIQNIGGMLGQYGANEKEEPGVIPFDADAEKAIAEIFGDQNATVLMIE